MAQDMRVFKTLVIGLGSTGTEILEALADRVEWEVGSLKRAPWLEFLAIETDVAKPSRFNGGDNFKTLGIPAAAWRDLVNRPEIYEDRIAISQWADAETLRQLPAQSVDSGAGHIRMVGRLALLYPPNYDEIKSSILQRTARLRNLTDAAAKTALNTDNAGQEMNVQFAVNESTGQTGIRVIVVGTLCGGTCSGTVNDVGILLRTVLDQQEKTLGIFTLPHPNLSIAQKPDAEIWKTNAYHALAELNQYHLHSDTERYRTVKFPDKHDGAPVVPDDTMPYDLVYLLRPNSTENVDLARLTQAIADRMFLNVFVPETDPMAYMVNAGPVSVSQGRAYAFSTFGLATIEYPLRRILEALKYRTLVHAVDRWKDRKSEGTPDGALDDLGLTIPSLTEALLLDEGGASVRSLLDAKRGEITRAARSGNVDAARKALQEWRSAFETRSGEGLAGLVHRTASGNRRRVAESVMQRVQGLVASNLLDYDRGPNQLLEVMQAVQPRLGALRGWEPGESKAGGATGVLDQLAAVRSNTLLGLFFLKSKASAPLQGALSRALDDELKSRVNTKVREALQDTGSGQRSDPGTLTLIDEETQKVARRLTALRKRLSNQTDLWREKRSRLENDAATVNGVSLFEPSPNGTVDKEEELAISEREKEAHGARLVRSWEALVRGVLPGVNDPDWLLGPWSPGQNNFETKQLNDLELLALEPFERTLKSGGKDVVQRLYDRRSPSFNPDSQVTHAASSAQLFLQLNEPQGQIDPMSPLPRRKLLIGTHLTDEFRRAIQPWTNRNPDAKVVSGIDDYRVVLLEEWYRFALKGADEVRDLAFSQPTRFNTYFTRKRSDIDWTPISDSELKALKTSEDLVLLAALHGALQLQGGYLTMDWPQTPGEPSEPERRRRRLPARYGKAARKLAFESRDEGGRSLSNAATYLHNEIESRTRTVVSSGATPQEGRRHYVQWIIKQMQESSARAVADWNSDAAQALLLRHLTADPEMRQALLETYPPDESLILGLYRNKGESLPKNQTAREDGFYCKLCGGQVGKTEEEVIGNGLRCSYHPEVASHPFGRPYSPFA